MKKTFLWVFAVIGVISTIACAALFIYIAVQPDEETEVETYYESDDEEYDYDAEEAPESARKAYDAIQNQTLHKGMTIAEVEELLGKPDMSKRDASGDLEYYYGNEDCKIIVVFDNRSVWIIHDNTYGAFDKW